MRKRVVIRAPVSMGVRQIRRARATALRTNRKAAIKKQLFSRSPMSEYQVKKNNRYVRMVHMRKNPSGKDAFRFSEGNATAIIARRKNSAGEWRVRLLVNGVDQGEESAYYTDDFNDAQDTAQSMATHASNAEIEQVRDNPASGNKSAAEQRVRLKGWKLLQEGRRRAGGGGIAPYTIVLSDTGEQPQPYVTHYLNLHDGGFYWGHYFEKLSDAVKDFEEREGQYRDNPAFRARGRRGNLVPKKATDEYADSRGKHVRLYSTEIVSLNPDGTVTLRSGGHMTVTTKRRMNEVSAQWGLGFSVAQKAYAWFVRLADGKSMLFVDGMTFNPASGEQAMKKNPRGPRRSGGRAGKRYRVVVTHGERGSIFQVFDTKTGRIKGETSTMRDKGGARQLADIQADALNRAADKGDIPPDVFHEPQKNPIKGRQFGGSTVKGETAELRKSHIALQERRGEAWITLALFNYVPATKQMVKDMAVRVGKRFHRKYPSKQLRIFG